MIFLGRDIDKFHSVLSDINTEVDNFFLDNRRTIGGSVFLPIQERNAEIADEVECLPGSLTTTDNIDRVIRSLTKEYVAIVDKRAKPALMIKKETLKNVISRKVIANTTSKITRLNKEIELLTRLHATYEPLDVSCLIVTAVLIEFRAIYRKLGIVLKGQNDFLFKALNRAKDDERGKRKDFWVEGVILRGGKYVKVAIQFLRKYGSIESESSTGEYIGLNPFFTEVISLGVAGQMDKTKRTMIGDLVISTGFYNAYDQKLGDSIIYSNTLSESLGDDYEGTMKQRPEDWVATSLVEHRPRVTRPARESRASRVIRGLFVSGPPVVKSAKYKQKIMNAFTDSCAVEMEGTGCHRALQGRNMTFKIIKGVCDWSDETKAKEWQPYCADLASEFCVDYLIAKYGRRTR